MFLTTDVIKPIKNDKTQKNRVGTVKKIKQNKRCSKFKMSFLYIWYTTRLDSQEYPISLLPHPALKELHLQETWHV